MRNLTQTHYSSRGELSNITTYQAGAMQASVHRILQKHSDAILEPYGISKMQWLIIGTVLDCDEDGARLTDVASALGTTMSFITNAVNLLESKKILVRTDHVTDNRSKLIYVDEAFKPRCAEIEKALRKSLRKSLYKHVDPSELRVYIRVLYQLSEIDKSEN